MFTFREPARSGFVIFTMQIYAYYFNYKKIFFLFSHFSQQSAYNNNFPYSGKNLPTYFRCVHGYIYHYYNDPPGTAFSVNPGGSVCRLNRYTPFRTYQNNFICVSVILATIASTSFSNFLHISNISGLLCKKYRR